MPNPKPVVFVGSSLDDLKEFPEEARREIGHAIYTAQVGGKHPSAKPLTGDRAFKGTSVLEIVEPFDTDTYRAVYTVQFEGVLYVLHAFQKKSKRGSATPKAEIERIKTRLKTAREDFETHHQKREAG